MHTEMYTHARTRICTWTRTHTLTVSRSLSYTDTDRHTRHIHTHLHTHTHTHTLSLSHTHTHLHTHTHTLSLSLPLTHTHTHTLSHTPSHIHTLGCDHEHHGLSYLSRDTNSKNNQFLWISKQDTTRGVQTHGICTASQIPLILRGFRIQGRLQGSRRRRCASKLDKPPHTQKLVRWSFLLGGITWVSSPLLGLPLFQKFFLPPPFHGERISDESSSRPKGGYAQGIDLKIKS